jgi:hypothetical protein
MLCLVRCVFYITLVFNNLLNIHHYLIEYLIILNTFLTLRIVLVHLMEPMLHATYPPLSNLDIEIGRVISLKMSLQYVTLSSYLHISYLVGRALHMIKGSYQMLYINMGYIYHLKSTI